MAFLLLIAFTAAIAALSSYLWTWTYWRRRGIRGPSEPPILGSALVMHNAQYPPYLQLRDWTKQYGSVYGITEGVARMLVISDPTLVQEVMVNQFDNFFGRKVNPIQGDPDKDKLVHLVTAQGQRWKRLRTISSPTFSNNSLRKLKNTVEESVVELMRHIEEQTAGGRAIDLLTFYQEYTLDVIGRIAMGQTDTQMFKNPMLPYVKAVFGERGKGMFIAAMVSPTVGWLIRQMLINLPNFVQNPAVHIIKTMEKAVKQRIAQRETDAENGIEPGEPQDFIDLFLDARCDQDYLGETNDDFSKTSIGKVTRQLTTDEIVGQCFVFLVAGFDTTALSLSYTSFLLATHPGVQTKLREEIDRECVEPEITFDQLARLKYLDQVIKETLRLYPLGALANSRRCMRDTRIGDVVVEKGVEVLCDTWTLHYDKKVWGEDADEFRPERWEECGEEHLEHKGAYIPFGLGPRQCIGMRLALMEEKLLLAHLLRKFIMQTGPETQIPLKLVGMRTTAPESVRLHLKLRDDI